MEDSVKKILKAVGENPNREGLKRTPERYAKALKFLTQGYQQDPITVINNAIFTEKYNEMILVKDIEIYSLCEHHLLPFFGHCHIAYIPNGKIVGLSKLARLAEIFARRLQVQERLTEEIADTIEKVLKPKGVAVVIEAKHMCMVMRGVQKQNSTMTTSSMRGVFLKNISTREEFLRLIK
jgi:GTP cyclohydrolase IA